MKRRDRHWCYERPRRRRREQRGKLTETRGEPAALGGIKVVDPAQLGQLSAQALERVERVGSRHLLAGELLLERDHLGIQLRVVFVPRRAEKLDRFGIAQPFELVDWRMRASPWAWPISWGEPLECFLAGIALREKVGAATQGHGPGAPQATPERHPRAGVQASRE